MLLTCNPKEMLCLDMNEIQLWVTQLKEQSIKLLNYEEFLQLMGFKSCNDRMRIYQKVYEELSRDARNFFTTKMIEGSIIHHGKFEKYFQLFAHRISPLIHSKKRIAELFEDTRCKGKIRNPLLPMLRQRIYGIALGYEDLNDHKTLRKDKAIQTAVERDRDPSFNSHSPWRSLHT